MRWSVYTSPGRPAEPASRAARTAVGVGAASRPTTVGGVTAPDVDPQRLSDPGRWPDPARPTLTFYDRRSGERTELSALTLANWVAKTASLGTDLLGLEPGERVRLALPTHWLGTVWVLAGLAAGWRLVPADAPPDTGADVIVLAESTLADWTRDRAAGDAPAGLDGFRDVVAVSTRPLAVRFGTELPAGALDYAGEVSSCADVFEPAGPPDDAVRAQTAQWLAAANELAGRHGLTASSRLVRERNPASAGGIVDTVLAPVLAAASVVLLADDPAAPDPAWSDHIAQVEGATRLDT